MRTIKTIPTLMLAVSLAAGMILVSEAAFARNDNRHEHNDHQEHNGMSSRNGDRSSAPETKRFSEPRKKDKGKDAVTGAGTGVKVTRRGTPPKGAVTTEPDRGGGFKVTHGGTPPRGPVTSPKPTTTATPAPGGAAPKSPVAGAPASAAVVSNGRVKLYIPNSSSGLTVTSNKSGTVTVSNGDPSHSVTLPGGSVTISGGGVTSVAGAPGVQIVNHPNGDFVAATTGPKKPEPGTVTGGPEGGFVNALGSGLKDTAGSLDPRQPFRATVNGPAPETSSTIQQ
jgi:hypothetical protein